MKIFSMPADFKERTIQEYRELNQQYENVIIRETYGQLTEDCMHMSGRAKSTIPQIGMRDLERYVEFSKKNGIEFNYTLNAACFGNYEFSDRGIKEIKDLICDLQNMGVNGLTLTTPGIIELVKSIAPGMNIKISAISQIDSVKKMKHYIDMGAERIVIEPAVTKNFTLLRNMAAQGADKMEVIVNDKCMRDCPYRIFHYNQTAHDNSERGKSFYFMSCGVKKSKDPQIYLNLNWIRPEDLHLYENIGIQNFKVEGREFVLDGDIVTLLKAYIGESFEGNLLDLLHIFAPYDTEHQPYIDNKSLNGYVEGFYNNTVKCDQICKQCGYCAEYMRKSFTMPEHMSSVAAEYYKGENSYIQRLKQEPEITIK